MTSFATGTNEKGETVRSEITLDGDGSFVTRRDTTVRARWGHRDDNRPATRRSPASRWLVSFAGVSARDRRGVRDNRCMSLSGVVWS